MYDGDNMEVSETGQGIAEDEDSDKESSLGIIGMIEGMDPAPGASFLSKVERNTRITREILKDIFIGQSETGDNSLIDVHLICRDGYVPVHGCLLSCVSQWFRNIFEIHGDCHCKNEILHVSLPDFDKDEISSIMNIIYRGVTLIENEKMGERLISAIKYFRIKMPKLRFRRFNDDQIPLKIQCFNFDTDTDTDNLQIKDDISECSSSKTQSYTGINNNYSVDAEMSEIFDKIVETKETLPSVIDNANPAVLNESLPILNNEILSLSNTMQTSEAVADKSKDTITTNNILNESPSFEVQRQAVSDKTSTPTSIPTQTSEAVADKSKDPITTNNILSDSPNVEVERQAVSDKTSTPTSIPTTVTSDGSPEFEEIQMETSSITSTSSFSLLQDTQLDITTTISQQQAGLILSNNNNDHLATKTSNTNAKSITDKEIIYESESSIIERSPAKKKNEDLVPSTSSISNTSTPNKNQSSTAADKTHSHCNSDDDDDKTKHESPGKSKKDDRKPKAKPSENDDSDDTSEEKVSVSDTSSDSNKDKHNSESDTDEEFELGKRKKSKPAVISNDSCSSSTTSSSEFESDQNIPIVSSNGKRKRRIRTRSSKNQKSDEEDEESDSTKIKSRRLRKRRNTQKYVDESASTSDDARLSKRWKSKKTNDDSFTSTSSDSESVLSANVASLSSSSSENESMGSNDDVTILTTSKSKSVGDTASLLPAQVITLSSDSDTEIKKTSLPIPEPEPKEEPKIKKEDPKVKVESKEKKVKFGLTKKQRLQELLIKAKTCQQCHTEYQSPSEASACLTKHGKLRCYFCYKVVKNTERLFTHFRKKHISPNVPKENVICVYCKQTVPFKSVSCHVISNHLTSDAVNQTKSNVVKPSPSENKDAPISSKSPVAEIAESSTSTAADRKKPEEKRAKKSKKKDKKRKRIRAMIEAEVNKKPAAEVVVEETSLLPGQREYFVGNGNVQIKNEIPCSSSSTTCSSFLNSSQGSPSLKFSIKSVEKEKTRIFVLKKKKEDI